MNGTITEKRFEKMTANEKLWLLYNTMCSREENYTKHFKRIYIIVGILFASMVMINGSESLSAMLKMWGIF